MRRSVHVLGSTVLLILLAGCWPVPGQNPSRTSHNPFEKQLTVETVGDLQEVWRYGVPLADGQVRSPVVSDGQVFVTQRCTIAAVDAKTGHEEWYAAIPDQFETCGPDSQADTIAGEPHVISDPDGDRVVAGYGYMQVMPPGREETDWFGASFDVATGERSGLDTGLIGAARGTQIVGSSRSGIGPATGATDVHLAGDESRSFTFDVGIAGSSYLPGLTLGTDQLFQAGTGPLATEPGDTASGYGLRAYSLTESRPGCGPLGTDWAERLVECPLWVTETDGTPSRPVLRPGGSVLYTSTAETLYALDASTGDVLWTADATGSRSAPALANGFLYVPAGDGRILVFDAEGCGEDSCSPSWELSTGTAEAAWTPTVAGDVIYVTAGGSVHALAAEPCGEPTCSEVLWSAPGESSPVVAHGQVYTTVGERLVVYGVG